MSDWLQRNPEIGHREYRSVWLLSSFLENEGFVVERNTAGMETAYKGIIHGKNTRPVVALLAEYDAQSEVGYGCGHNIITTSVLGAALGLKDVMAQVEGALIIMGCPSEEVPMLPSSESVPHKPGGKTILIEKGVFDDVDLAMMVHPAREFSYMKRTRSVASTVLQISFMHGFPHSKGAFSDTATKMTLRIESMRKE